MRLPSWSLWRPLHSLSSFTQTASHPHLGESWVGTLLPCCLAQRWPRCSCFVCGQHSAGHLVRCGHRSSPVCRIRGIADGYHQHRASSRRGHRLCARDRSVELVGDSFRNLQRNNLVGRQNHNAPKTDNVVLNLSHEAPKVYPRDEPTAFDKIWPVLPRIEPHSMLLERKPVNRLANCLLEIDTEALKFAIRSETTSQRRTEHVRRVTLRDDEISQLLYLAEHHHKPRKAY